MRIKNLRKMIIDLRNVLLRFSGSEPKRGKRANALFVSSIPSFIFSHFPFQEALEQLNSIDPTTEHIELMQRLGADYHSVYLLLKYNGTWESSRTISETDPAWGSITAFELKINRDGWAYPTKQSLKFKW